MRVKRRFVGGKQGWQSCATAAGHNRRPRIADEIKIVHVPGDTGNGIRENTGQGGGGGGWDEENKKGFEVLRIGGERTLHAYGLCVQAPKSILS